MGELLSATLPPTDVRKKTDSRRGLLLWAGFVVGIGLLLFTYHYLGAVAEGSTEGPLAPLIDEMTGALATGLLFFPIRELCRRRPLRRGRGSGACPSIWSRSACSDSPPPA